LLYISPKSLQPDVQKLLELSIVTHTKHRKNRVLNLFLDYKAEQGISLPTTGDFPDAFAELNNPTQKCVTRWTQNNTPEKRLKQMVKQFRKNLAKSVTLSIGHELSKVMMSYLMFSIIPEMQNSDEEGGGGAQQGLVARHENPADGTGGTMFSKKYYFDNILLICKRVNLNDKFTNDCKRLIAEYFVRNNFVGSDINVGQVTNRRTGGSHSDITPNSFPQQRSL